jgi:hypothetical protein
MVDDLLIENIRLSELVLVVNQNQPFFLEFEAFLKARGYETIHSFILETSSKKAEEILTAYFQAPFTNQMFDGIGRPLTKIKAKWYFMAWLFRDAAEQRLKPLLKAVEGTNLLDRRVVLLNKIREYVSRLFPRAESWTWPVLSEVMLDRLEGSRRSKRGSQFEKTARRILGAIVSQHGLAVTVAEKGVKLFGETYDIQVIGAKGKILLPVKTRETMGGGHALLFTRDIHKSISVAQTNGYECLPIIIAESWTGDLSSLPCKACIYIPMNPNLVDRITPLLESALENHVSFLASIS